MLPFAALVLVLAADAGRADDGPVPVLVELFTSEGCNTCPPADELLARLEREQPVAGARIVPLSLHVDYWNSKGWTDPYCIAAVTERQRRLCEAIGVQAPYTPQMVVDGAAQCLGRDETGARVAIMDALREQKAQASLVPVDGGSAVRVVATDLPQGGSGASLEVMLAVAENGLTSAVTGGENRGRSLSHAAVVRSLKKVDELPAAAPRYEKRLPIAWDAAWKRENVVLVVFFQDSATRRIVGVATASLR